MFSNLIIRFIVEKQEDTDTNCFYRSNKLVFSNFFTKRIVPIWNHLSDSCFNGDALFFLNMQLHNTDLSRFFVWSLIVVIIYNEKMCACFWRLFVAFPFMSFIIYFWYPCVLFCTNKDLYYYYYYYYYV